MGQKMPKVSFFVSFSISCLSSPRFSHDKRGICHSQGQFCEVEREEEEEGKEASDEREAVFLPPPSVRATFFFWGKEDGEYGRGGEGRGGGGIERPLFFHFCGWYAGKKHFSEGLRSTSCKRGRLCVSHATDSLRSVILLSPSEVLFCGNAVPPLFGGFLPLHCMRAFKSGVANKSSPDDQRETSSLYTLSFLQRE